MPATKRAPSPSLRLTSRRPFFSFRFPAPTIARTAVPFHTQPNKTKERNNERTASAVITEETKKLTLTTARLGLLLFPVLLRLPIGVARMCTRSQRAGSAAALSLLALVGVLLAFSLGAGARKQLPMNTPYPAVVQNALRCDVCSFVVTNALYQVDAKREELQKKRLSVREDDVLEEVENMCIPFKEQGQWIRQVALQVEEVEPSDSADAASPQYHMNVGVLDYYTRCGRVCDTVAALCEVWMDSDAMDGFSGRLVKEAQKGRDMSGAPLRDAVFGSFCAPSPHCKKHATYVRKLDAALTKDEDLRDAIAADKPVEIESEEREMETMLHRLTREQGQSADVFARDEIRQMKEAFATGTKEDVQAIDPTAFDLNDDEFETIQQYMRQEEAQNNGGGQQQQQQQQKMLQRRSYNVGEEDL